MVQKIFDSVYKNLNAVTMENDYLSAKFLPDNGGKLASLIQKRTSREFLVQAKNPTYKALEYDGNYVEAECSGFDDMFPTIDRVYYQDYPWKGIEIPDHGEVCGSKWGYEIHDDFLYMYVYGVRFPYMLEKWVRFDSDNILNINYTATNLSNFDMDFIWAAHMMINMEEGGELLVPYKGCQNVTSMFSTDDELGKYGDLISWPETVQKSGNIHKINLTQMQNDSRIAYKYYFNERIPEGWCAYCYKSDGTTIKLSYPKDRVPYLGIWINEGDFKEYYNIALEPCTGSFDRPDIAKMHKRNSVLKAKDEYQWFLNINIE